MNIFPLISHKGFAVLLILSGFLCGCSEEMGNRSYQNMIERGVANLEQGQLDIASESFEKAKTSYPDKAESYYWLGRIMELKTQNVHDEINYYTKALERNRDYVEVYDRMGYAYTKIGQFENARKIFKDRLDRNLGDIKSVYNSIAITYFYEEKLDLAKEYYEKALDLDEKYTFALNGLAKIYLAENNYSKTRNLLERSLRLDPSVNNRGVYADLANVAEKQGNYDEAIRYWQEFLDFTSMPPQDRQIAEFELDKLIRRKGEK